ADNARLNEEMKRSTVELGNLYRQLRLAQAKIAKSGALAGAGTAEADGAVAALQQENARLKKTVEDEAATLRERQAQVAAATEVQAALAADKAALEQQLAAARARPPAAAESPTGPQAQELAQTRQALVAARRETEE
ncbi:MAG: hypothetical protein NT173_00950, partial [Opitutales bacterium]|nr:hypothetical protein [Opitutales bacterium]